MPREKIEVFGATIEDLPKKWQGLDVIVIAKALNEEGKVSFVIRYSEGLTTWEAIGLLRVSESVALRDVLDDLDDEEDDDDKEDPNQ